MVESMSSSRARVMSVVVAGIGGLLGAVGLAAALSGRAGGHKRSRPPVRGCGRNHFVFSRYKKLRATDNRSRL
ncbi:hypothetical protein GCM10009864_57320 [Streptomyces lunalinharesii]|uniref:Uncharacterized protein n=1 Tax=Streptomyces lunalinharesii TaxID=333384 RepID=A0ABN3SK11_9ACTN